MKTPTVDQLNEAFEKATVEGPDYLAGTDRDFYLIQDFILEWEEGALSEFLYDSIPDFDLLHETIVSMKRHGLSNLAAFLAEAVDLFKDYQETNPVTLWRATVERHDPTHKLADLDEKIRQLPNFGLEA